MKIEWTDAAWKEYTSWKKRDASILRKINHLIGNISLSPFSGIGKPEPLKGNLSPLWSRRITKEHRLVYLVKEKVIVIVQCRYHYKK